MKSFGTCLYGDGNLVSRFVPTAMFDQMFEQMPTKNFATLVTQAQGNSCNYPMFFNTWDTLTASSSA